MNINTTMSHLSCCMFKVGGTVDCYLLMISIHLCQLGQAIVLLMLLLHYLLFDRCVYWRVEDSAAYLFVFISMWHVQLLKWSRGILGKWFFGKLMRQTFYGHFVAGADQESIKPVITANRQFGVKSILDYSSEKDISHAEAVEAEMM